MNFSISIIFPAFISRVTEKTRRSQFLAYFSFSSLNSTDGLGFPQRGGMRLQNTGKRGISLNSSRI